MRISNWLFKLVVTLLPASQALMAAEKPLALRFGVAAVGTGNRPVFGGANAASVHIKGLLEEEFRRDGIKIEWNYFKGAGPAVNEAIANDLLDFAWQGDLPSIIGKSSGLKTKIRPRLRRRPPQNGIDFLRISQAS
jgi:sulfonate transport system substrate-binding protein